MFFLVCYCYMLYSFSHHQVSPCGRCSVLLLLLYVVFVFFFCSVGVFCCILAPEFRLRLLLCAEYGATVTLT